MSDKSPQDAPNLKAALVGYFATLLRTPPAAIATDVNLLELGADSIMLVEAQRRLETEFGCRIEMQDFFEELNTIDRIAAHLASTGAVPRAPEVPALAAATTPPVAAVAMPLVAAATLPRPLSPAIAPAEATADSPLHALLRAQLALVAETIEAQNRLIAGTFRPAAAGKAPDEVADAGADKVQPARITAR